MQNQTHVQNLKDTLIKVTAVDPSQLKRIGDLGKLAFISEQDTMNNIVDYAAQLLNSSLSKIPGGDLTKLTSTFNKAVGLFERVQSFDVEQHSASEKKQLSSELDSLWESMFSDHAHVWLHLFRDITNLDSVKRDVADVISNARDDIALAKDEVDQAKKDIQESASAAAQAATDAGIGVHSTTYEKHYKIDTRYSWGCAGILSLISGMIVWRAWILAEILSLASSTTKGADPKMFDSLVNLYITQVAGEFGLILLSVIAGRVVIGLYKSFVHSAKVRLETYLALTTFRAFAEGTENPDVKDAIRLGTAGLVFAHKPTGFSDKDNSTQEISSIVEMASKLKGK